VTAVEKGILGRNHDALVEMVTDGVPAALESPQWMIGGHASVEINDGQEVGLGLRFFRAWFSDEPVAAVFKLRANFSITCYSALVKEVAGIAWGVAPKKVCR
jgi:hypothetical protein